MAGELDRALADSSEAIRLAPAQARAYANRGDVYRQQGDLERAMADLDEALRLDPTLTAAYTNRGLTHEARGNIEQARNDFTAALQHLQSRTITAKAAAETARTRLAALPAAGASAASAIDRRVVLRRAVSRWPGRRSPQAAPPGEKRVALVIGNSAYRSAPPLANARRDADTMAATLRRVGFETVDLEGDLPREKLVEALRAFARLAETADWALIYYAGHGIEVNGVNYLIPVDARLATDRDVLFEALPLDHLLGAVEGCAQAAHHPARRLPGKPVRPPDAPCAAPWRRARSAAASPGVEPDGGTLVAYVGQARRRSRSTAKAAARLSSPRW